MELSVDPRHLIERFRARERAASSPSSRAANSERAPVIRRMDFDFAAALDAGALPRHWLDGSVMGTALANGVNLLFPAGERFFVRSVNCYLDSLDDPALHERVKRFFGQEGQHAKEHQRFFEILREQGYDVDAFLVPYQRMAYEWLEPRVHPKLRLAITAALEHFTATLAEHALSTRFFETRTPPEIAALLLWHAAEEIEHKDVAFDVLQAVDDSYALRAAGAFAGAALLGGFWVMATIILLRQEPELDWGRLAREYKHAIESGHASGGRMAGALLQYLRPGFHPADTGNDELAARYLDEIGRLYA
ncbi:metal-dependent hydrolase [Pseudenhygromyxa sp. WMMC2535]|uniref:metal-dependent hydrolase n=1 Tax=Pseudenhygromyxa sp. WMMC2535 TaxID=2712867 RepID=UPI001556CE9C|nr:metal-dependent hydrolase [Pseudenhygromyxa sp. WMMC2535]NVB40054.1 metal-dependent hydrolase [Pseudenhygromyxa sp. WMMC2535]